MTLRCCTVRMCPRGLRCLVAVIVAGVGAVASPADVSVELADGTSPSGTIVKLTDASLDLVVDGSPRSVGIREIRRVTWKAAGSPQQAGGTASNLRPVRVGLVDGSVLEADDLALSEKAASVVRDGRTFPLDRGAIETAEFRAATVDEAGGKRPAWLGKLEANGQERAAGSDVVVVGSPEKPEFVECAIVAVTPDAVSVLLDEETIRVKRSKVIGLKWLRNRAGGPAGDAALPAAIVDFDGGRLLARKVTIDGDEVAIGLDGGEPIRVPSSAMRRIDFTSGRTVSLVSLEPERVEVEPWFGLFKSLDGLAGHFEPRRVAVTEGAVGGETRGRATPQDDPREGLRLRPRSVIAWRLPEHARSVVMTLSESSSVVTIAIDGREAYRGQPSTPVPVVADAAGGRRLVVTVDFPTSGPGTGGPAAPEVVLVDPRIER